MSKRHRQPRRSRKRQKATISRGSGPPVIRVEKSWQHMNKSRKKVAYFIRGNKSIKYHHGLRSRILYIGSTEERNAKRPFESLRDRAETLFEEHRLKWLDVVYIKARGRQRVPVAEKLEEACLCQFLRQFGELPKGNTKGKTLILKEEEKHLRKYFNFDRIGELLTQLGEPES